MFMGLLFMHWTQGMEMESISGMKVMPCMGGGGHVATSINQCVDRVPEALALEEYKQSASVQETILLYETPKTGERVHYRALRGWPSM